MGWWNLRLGFLILFQVICATCSKNSSLTFVIDDTKSMNDEIKQVKEAVGAIMDIVMSAKASEIEDVVLVTFNDPSWTYPLEPVARHRTTTSRKEELIGALNRIKVHGGDDCPEYSLTGIKLALEKSRHGSYLFVFTDADAKDKDLLNDVKSLCEKKESQVIFIVTDSRNCYYNDFRPYYEIARASSGLVFRVKKDEVKNVVETIKYTLNDKKAVLTNKVLPSNTWNEIPFIIDDKTEYAIILTSAQNVQIVITTLAKDRTMDIKQIMWQPSGKAVQFYPPRPGTYLARVKGKTEVSIIIYARTDFTFEHGFSKFVPKFLSDTSKQPIANGEHHLSIKVVDPDHTVDIQTAEILDMAEKVIKTLPLKKARHGDFYITDTFVSPSTMFKIQVAGTVTKTGRAIRRISKTAIEPQIPPPPASKPPSTTIVEGSSIDVDYGGGTTLTCVIFGYPKPEILWTTKSGAIYHGVSHEVEPGVKYISYLKLINVRRPEVYYCTASNKEGRKSSVIYVRTRSPFSFDASPTDTTISKYGAKTDITCRVKSSFPYTIRWYRSIGSKITEIIPSNNYKISPNGSILHIQHTDINAIGNYTCEASLKNDIDTKLNFTTDVRLGDLSPPVILGALHARKIVRNKDRVNIICKIASGTPRPTISWQVMTNRDNEFKDLTYSGQELTVDSATLKDAGLYRCSATNAVGRADKKTEVVVHMAAVVNIQEGSKKSVAYGNSTTLTCKIVAFPLPKVGWKDDKGLVLNSKDITNNTEIISKLSLQNVKANATYSCFTDNFLGYVSSHINLSVTSPFVVLSHPEDTTISKYGAKTDITCRVKSSFPYTIRWYRSIGSKITEIIPSNNYKISPNGSILHIQHTDINAIGNYTCEASLKNDIDTKLNFTTDVRLGDLSPPVILGALHARKIVRNKDRVNIICKIASGTPRPTISWQVMTNRDNEFKDLTYSGQELTVDSATLKDAGLYRCSATNAVGRADKKTEVVVHMAAVVNIQEGSKKSVAYGNSTTLTCKIVAFPLPKVGWKDDKGLVLNSKDITNNTEIISKLSLQNVKANATYSCFTDNFLGYVSSHINLSVTSPFVVLSHPEDTTISKYGAKTDITCRVKSSFPYTIRWYRSIGSKITEIIPSNNYKISPNGSILHIQHTDINAIGNYTCEASLKNDIDTKLNFTTDVRLGDLSPPVILGALHARKIVRNKDRVNIICKIASGTPRPTISWQVMTNRDNEFKDLTYSGQELTVDSATLKDAGLYRCSATNAVGRADKKTEVVVHMAAVVNIQEGSKKSVAYGNSTTLTCKIVAFPLPKVGWKDDKGLVLNSKDITNNTEIISKLSLQNVKANATYSCFADNFLGYVSSHINLSVTSPFVVLSYPEDTTISKYGAKTDITCRVKSSFPYTIRWYRSIGSKITEIIPSNNYKISPNGSILHIQHTDINAIGNYTCEASLKNDIDTKLNFTTDVRLGDLSPPVILGALHARKIVRNKDRVNIICKIASGTPRPTISWQVMTNGDNEFKDLTYSGQELTVDSATLKDAGLYRCSATNAVGRADKKTEVVVHMAAVVNIQEGSKKSVAYGNSTTLTCKIVAFPLPKVGWKDDKGLVLNSKDITNNTEIISKLSLQNVKANATYSCFADNFLGYVSSHINLSVTSPFVVLSHPEDTTISKYGAKTDITCRVKSSFPYTIRWYRSIGSKITEIIPSNNYKISPNGSILHIQHTDINAIGNYTCEASLKNDLHTKLNFTTDVRLGDLSPPVILGALHARKIVRNKDRVNIICKIASGTPRPTVNWQVIRNGDNEFKDLTDLGQELTFDSATLNDAGLYRCNATNAMGHANKTTELIVNLVPEVSIDEGASVIGTYGTTTVLNCIAVAYPPPKIVWRDNEGQELASTNTKNKNEVSSRLTVRNIKTSKTQYNCSAQNDLGTTVASVQVTVSSPIVFPKHLSETTDVKYGDPCTIFCDVKSSHDMTIRWFHQKNEHSEKSEIHQTDKYMISPDKRKLYITNMDLDLVGNYTCEASLVSNKYENISLTTTVKINNLKAPQITYINNTVTVMHGDELFITCKSTGIPEPETTWQVKVKGSDKFKDKDGFGQDLINSKISYEWAGLYKCTAANQIGTDSRTIEVVVHGKPNITNSEFVYFGVTGDRVLNIPCEVTGVPEPTIIWKHGNKEVSSGPKIVVIKNYVVINNPTEKDSSNYTCEAKNVYGNVAANFVAIISDFDFGGDTDSDTIYYLKPGESTNIKCLLTYSDPQSVRWYVNGENSNVVGTFYNISDAKFENDGNYTCRVNNDHGSESQNYIVDVGYKPRFKNVALPTTYLWKGGKDESLDCNVNAKPNEEVEWVLNGKPLKSKELDLPISGWGIYSCNVSNYHGSVQHTYDVTSDGCLINKTVERTQNTPILLGNDPTTWPQFDSEGSSEFVTVKQHQTVTLQCATVDQPQNTFKTHPTSKMIIAKCYKEDKFIIEDKTYKFEDLQCEHYVKSSVRVPNKTCMKTGETVEIGFKLNNGFLGVYEVCYSNADNKTLFTKVVMSNGNLGSKVESLKECQFNQRWLVNPNDVAFGPAQAATLSNKYNAVPVYEPCNNSSRISWSKVEYDIQMVFFEDSLTVWTGTSDYASDGVPRYLWKVVKFEDAFESIVYVNSPTADVDYVCPPKSSSVLENSDQYTYSCDMDDFVKAFNLSKSDFGI